VIQYQRNRGRNVPNRDRYRDTHRGGALELYERDNERGRHRGDNEFGNYRLRMEIPEFNGQLHIEQFLDWISEVERFFDCMEIPDAKKVKLVVLKFKGGAAAWWDQTTANRAKFQRRPITTWDKLKKLLKERFLPVEFQSILYTQYLKCKQGQRTVTEYTEEFHRLGARNNLMESEEQQMARYIAGLKSNLQEKVFLQSHMSLMKAISLAEQLERQATKYSSFSVGSSSKHSYAKDKGYSAVQEGKTATEEAVDLGKGKKPAATDQAWGSIKCYKCQEMGHKANNCPKKGANRLCEGIRGRIYLQFR